MICWLATRRSIWVIWPIFSFNSMRESKSLTRTSTALSGFLYIGILSSTWSIAHAMQNANFLLWFGICDLLVPFKKSLEKLPKLTWT